LNHIETGAVNPTVIQAIRLVDALGLTLSGLVSRGIVDLMDHSLT
jgi:hypothetical protein